MDDRAEYACAPGLGGLRLFRADIVRYSFKRHSHDYYVVGIIERGVQRFSCGRRGYLTPPRGLVVINPGEAHTGESALPSGFRYRAFYPESSAMEAIARELGASPAGMPAFPEPVIEDDELYARFLALDEALARGAPFLEQESCYLHALAGLVSRHTEARSAPRRVPRESRAIVRARALIEARYGEDLRLADLAGAAGLSPFYFLRAFRAATGLPPHAFLASVRVREAQRLLRAGRPLAEVAFETGFSSQSHFSSVFKGLIGVSPGSYARAIS